MSSPVDEFFDAIAPYLDIHRQSVFQYLAVRRGAEFFIIKARLRLRAVPDNVPFTHFASANVRSGQYRLEQLGADPRRIVDALCAGALQTPHGPLLMLPNDAGLIEQDYQPFHPEGLSSNHHLPVLSLFGAKPSDVITQPSIDWELKAQQTPYFDLPELASQYGLGPIPREKSAIEIISETIAFFTKAELETGGATFSINLALGADISKFQLGYRAIIGPDIERRCIGGPNLTWTNTDTAQVGTTIIPVPDTAFLFCVASYDGFAQAQLFLSHPSNFPNPLRQAYETFDPSLAKLKEAIDTAKGKGYAARDFEAAMSWLFWMHGFQVVYLDGGQQVKIDEAPDLVVFTPGGDFAVVECTTGILKADNKVAKLIDRTARLRAQLNRQGQSHRQIIPVIVTSKTGAEVAAECAEVEHLGVLVVAREQIDQFVQETFQVPEPQKAYLAALERIRSNLQQP